LTQPCFLAHSAMLLFDNPNLVASARVESGAVWYSSLAAASASSSRRLGWAMIVANSGDSCVGSSSLATGASGRRVAQRGSGLSATLPRGSLERMLRRCHRWQALRALLAQLPRIPPHRRAGASARDRNARADWMSSKSATNSISCCARRRVSPDRPLLDASRTGKAPAVAGGDRL
jgi:hypothetical protein